MKGPYIDGYILNDKYEYKYKMWLHLYNVTKTDLSFIDIKQRRYI